MLRKQSNFFNYLLTINFNKQPYLCRVKNKERHVFFISLYV